MKSRATIHIIFLSIIAGLGIFGFLMGFFDSLHYPEDPGERIYHLLFHLSLFVVLGIYAALTLLPDISDRVGRFFFDSAEEFEPDPAAEAHALVAQGDYIGAIEAFQELADNVDDDRRPAVEIVRLYREKLKDPDSAIQFLHHALEAYSWGPDNAAYLLFRLSELYAEDMQDMETAKNILEQVVTQFEGTRHAANANHKLRHWQEGGEAPLTSPFGMGAYAASEAEPASSSHAVADLPPAEDDSELPPPEKPA